MAIEIKFEVFLTEKQSYFLSYISFNSVIISSIIPLESPSSLMIQFSFIPISSRTESQRRKHKESRF